MPTLLPPPPHSLEAESAVVGSLILNPTSAIADILPTGLSPDDFYIKHYGETYRCLVDMASNGTGIDLVTLKNELQSRKVLTEQFTIEKLAEMLDTVPTAANAGHYAKIVKRKAIDRHLLRIHQEIGRRLSSGEELNGELDELAKVSRQLDLGMEGSIPVPKSSNLVLGGISDMVDFIIKPILIRGCITQIQGDPKAGKSCLALLIALACALGRWVSGRWEFMGQPCRVLYLSYEDNKRRIKHRAKQYLPGLGAPPFPENLLLLDKNFNIDLTTRDGYLALKTFIQRDRIEVLILDTISYVHSAEENSKKEMQPVMENLRKLVEEFPISIVVIHHTNKAGGEDTPVVKRGRGSSAIAANMDVILDFGNRVSTNTTACRLESKEEPGKDEFVVVYKPQEDGSVLWSLEEDEGTPALKAKKEKILEAIGELEKTSPEGVLFSTLLASLPDIPRKTLLNNVKAFVDEGKLEEIKGVGPRNANAYRIKR